jgi:AcrR family transcriptional regulator
MPRGEKTYEKILDTALDLISRSGYEGTSIKDITDQLGLTKAAFYSHFQTKNDLLSKLIENHEKVYIDKMIQTVNETPGNAIDKLHRYISFNSGFGLKHKESVMLFYSLSDEMKDNKEIEPILTRCNQKLEHFLTYLLDTGKNQGLVRKDLDSTIMALLLMSFARGVFDQVISNISRLNGEELIRTFRKIIFQGIKPV